MLETPKGARDINELAQNLLRNIKDPLNNALQKQINNVLQVSSILCADPDLSMSSILSSIPFETNGEKFGVSFIVGCVMSCGFIGGIFFTKKKRALSSQQTWLLSLPEDQLLVLYMKQVRSKYKETELNWNTSSMIESAEIPRIF